MSVDEKKYAENAVAEVPSSYGYGVRHVQLVIFFVCLSTTFIARGHLGVTIVALTRTIENQTDNDFIQRVNESNADLNNTEMELEVSDSRSVFITYDWPKSIQETILGSFFLGYCIMMFPGGMICQRWGGKLPFQISLFINGIISIATPWITMWGGWKAVCGCRIIQGMSQAGTLPSVQVLLSNWVSRNERGTLSSYLYTGTTVGNVLAFQISGVLADSRWGWPSIFWAVGAACIISFILLTIFGAASPRNHKSISEEEKNYILGRVSNEVVKNRRVPWKAILTSRPVWATFFTHIGSGVAYAFFFTQVPSFIHYILGIDVKSSGLLTSLPYVASFFTSISFGLISDFCTNRNIVSVKNARRISNSISQFGVALFLILASFATDTAVAVICLVGAMGCQMGIHTGWMVNHIDLAPHFTGTIMSIGNTLMNGCVLLIPVLVSYTVTDVRNPHQWRVVFGLVAALAIICNILFVIFLSTDKQPWDSEDYNAMEGEKRDVKETGK